MSELAIHYARNAPEQAARPVNKLLQYISHIFTCVSLLTGLVWPLLHRLPSISQFHPVWGVCVRPKVLIVLSVAAASGT
jgi:hypothetical protein